MITNYLEQIKRIIAEKNISLGFCFNYIIKIHHNVGSEYESFYSYNVKDDCWCFVNVEAGDLYQIYEAEDKSFTIYIHYDSLYNKYNVKWKSEYGDDFFSSFLHREDVKFKIVHSLDVHFANYLNTTLSAYTNYKGNDIYSISAYKHSVNCECEIAVIGKRMFKVYYEYITLKKMTYISLKMFSHGGAGIFGGVKKDGIVRAYSELHYDQKFLKQLSDFKVSVLSATTKRNKYFYRRFEKYLT